MSQAHIGQTLALKNQSIPISKDTTFHASFDNDLSGSNQGFLIEPLGFQKSLSFDSTKANYGAAYVNNLPSGASARTLECWVYPISSALGGSPAMAGYPLSATQPGTANTIFEINYSSSANAKFGVHLWSNQLYSTNTFVINKWYHVAATYDGTNVKLYVDGVLEGTLAVTLNTFVNVGSYNFNIRRSVNPSDGPIPGNISDVRVWNTARTLAQIKSTMNVELTGTETGLIAHWKLNEGQGTVIYDLVFGNDGRLFGTVPWTEGRTIATLITDGKFGGAVAIEEATRNLIPDPTFVTGVSPSGSITAREVYDDIIDGMPVKVMKMQYTGTGDGHTAQNMNLGDYVQSTPYTLSFYVKADQPADLYGYNAIQYFTTAWQEINWTTTTLPTSWTKITVTGTTLAEAATSLRLILRPPSVSGVNIYYAFPQVEQKAFSTSFVNGSRSNGVLWYPKSVINIEEGTISFWVKPRVYSTPSPNPIFSSGIDSAAGSFDLLFATSSTSHYLRVYGPSSSIQLFPSRTSYLPLNTWSHVVITWKRNIHLQIYINGILADESLAPIDWGPSFLSAATGLYFGSGTRANPNILIDEVRVDRISVSDDEILSWYYGGPHYNHFDMSGKG